MTDLNSNDPSRDRHEREESDPLSESLSPEPDVRPGLYRYLTVEELKDRLAEHFDDYIEKRDRPGEYAQALFAEIGADSSSVGSVEYRFRQRLFLAAEESLREQLFLREQNNWGYREVEPTVAFYSAVLEDAIRREHRFQAKLDRHKSLDRVDRAITDTLKHLEQDDSASRVVQHLLDPCIALAQVERDESAILGKPLDTFRPQLLEISKKVLKEGVPELMHDFGAELTDKAAQLARSLEAYELREFLARIGTALERSFMDNYSGSGSSVVPGEQFIRSYLIVAAFRDDLEIGEAYDKAVKTGDYSAPPTLSQEQAYKIDLAYSSVLNALVHANKDTYQNNEVVRFSDAGYLEYWNELWEKKVERGQDYAFRGIAQIRPEAAVSKLEDLIQRVEYEEGLEFIDLGMILRDCLTVTRFPEVLADRLHEVDSDSKELVMEALHEAIFDFPEAEPSSEEMVAWMELNARLMD